MANCMTKRGNSDNIITYEHFCDTHDDLLNIPKNESTLGSTAVVIDDEGTGLGIYIANSENEWIPLLATSSSDDNNE